MKEINDHATSPVHNRPMGMNFLRAIAHTSHVSNPPHAMVEIAAPVIKQKSGKRDGESWSGWAQEHGMAWHGIGAGYPIKKSSRAFVRREFFDLNRLFNEPLNIH